MTTSASCLLQFVENGCENCPFLAMEGDRERCMDCTTVAFQGLITVIDPTASWAAKWLHVCEQPPPAASPVHAPACSLMHVLGSSNDDVGVLTHRMHGVCCAAKFVPGCYALSVQGELPAQIEDILAEHRITWHKTVD